MKIICILFQVGRNKNKISKDSRLRLLAGAELAKENDSDLAVVQLCYDCNGVCLSQINGRVECS